jgi:hypothetical protein
VAPSASFDTTSAGDGPRVALPDHERRWETAIRTPFRVFFFPLKLAGKGIEAGASYFGPRYFDLRPARVPKPGPKVRATFSLDSPTDIGVGPHVAWDRFPTEHSKLRLDATWSLIDHRRVRLTETIGYRRPYGLRLRVNYDLKPNRRYYGIGNDTPDSNHSYYELESTLPEVAILVGASPLRQFRVGGGYSLLTPRRASHGTPPIEDRFDPGTVPFQGDPTADLWYGIGGDYARLDDDRAPSLGIHGRVDLRRAMGVSSSDPDYYQWHTEGRAYLPVFAKRRVLAFRGVYAGIEPAGSTTTLPFYRLTQSAREFQFAAYPAGRFRDRQLMIARVEYRWVILHDLYALALFERAEVAPRVGEFRWGEGHDTVGGGLRLGRSDEAALRIEIGKGSEGLHAILDLQSDF